VLAGFISAGIFPTDKPIIIKKNSSFLSLNDTPTDYSGQTGKVVKVNSDENGLEWATDETGAGGTDTNAATECSNGEVLFGDATCGIPIDTNIFSSGISDCSAGDYVYGFNSNGTMDCSTPAGGGTDTNWQYPNWDTFDANMQSQYYPLGSDANTVFGGAGWDNVTTLETCKTHIDDASNPHTVDLNQAYNSGSTIDVDDTDVLWNLDWTQQFSIDRNLTYGDVGIVESRLLFSDDYIWGAPGGESDIVVELKGRGDLTGAPYSYFVVNLEPDITNPYMDVTGALFIINQPVDGLGEGSGEAYFTIQARDSNGDLMDVFQVGNSIPEVGIPENDYPTALRTTSWVPLEDATYDMGASDFRWQDLWLAGDIKGQAVTQTLAIEGDTGDFKTEGNFLPLTTDDDSNVGTPSLRFHNLYIAGHISDGDTNLLVADLVGWEDANATYVTQVDGNQWYARDLNDAYSKGQTVSVTGADINFNLDGTSSDFFIKKQGSNFIVFDGDGLIDLYPAQGTAAFRVYDQVYEAFVINTNNNRIEIGKGASASNYYPLYPVTDNVNDLGATSHRFKDLYLSGNLTDDTTSLAITDICSWTDANATYVKQTDGNIWYNKVEDSNNVSRLHSDVIANPPWLTWSILNNVIPWADVNVSDDLTVNWTGLQNYPSACSAGDYVHTIGDTLTCSTPSYTTDTNAATECSGTQALFGDGSCAVPTDTNVFSSGVSDCSAGDYVYGFNTDGTMDCSTPAGGTDTTLDTNSSASTSWLGTAHTWTANQTFSNDIIANGAITGDNATDITGIDEITADANITTSNANGKAWMSPDTNSINVGNDSGLVGCMRIVDGNLHIGFC